MRLPISALLAIMVATPLLAQQPPRRQWEVKGIPALNFDADEGMGYGVILELYNYGDGSMRPYAFTVQPNVFLTTGGRRDVSVFMDAPRMLPGGLRLTGTLAREQQLSTPYYGLGNDTERDEARETAPNDYFYRFGQTRRVMSVDLQRRIANLPLRALAGTRVSTVTLDPLPFDSGSTLLAQEISAGADQPLHGWWNAVRAGIVWDTRDREVGPRRGSWSDILVQRYDRALGSERSYTRWTITDRRYIPLGSSLTFANRFLLQGAEGDVPVHDLSTVETSFKRQDGLGGAKTVRGLPRNRYQGKSIFVWNSELRWSAADFNLLRSRSHLVLSAFTDAGRVWTGGVNAGSLFSDLHRGYGAGVRLGMGDSFVVALDVGHSSQSTAPIYIGLGYLY